MRFPRRATGLLATLLLLQGSVQGSGAACPMSGAGANARDRDGAKPTHGVMHEGQMASMNAHPMAGSAAADDVDSGKSGAPCERPGQLPCAPACAVMTGCGISIASPSVRLKLALFAPHDAPRVLASVMPVSYSASPDTPPPKA